MSKRIEEKDFFTRDAKEVAIDLIGKYIGEKGKKEKYLIYETEAYYHNEKYENGKYICYGADKTKIEAKRDVSAPLFEKPGTWCIYDGQLLLSVTNDEFSDNVLIKKVKNEAGEILGPDKIACNLHLYKSKPDYCGCHGKHALSDNSTLYLMDGEEDLKIISAKRTNINDDKILNFKIEGEQ